MSYPLLGFTFKSVADKPQNRYSENPVKPADSVWQASGQSCGGSAAVCAAVPIILKSASSPRLIWVRRYINRSIPLKSFHMIQKDLFNTFGCQMNKYDSSRMVEVRHTPRG